LCNEIYKCVISVKIISIITITVDQYFNIPGWVTAAVGPMISQLLLDPTGGCIQLQKGQNGQKGPQLLRSRLLWLLGEFLVSVRVRVRVRVKIYYQLYGKDLTFPSLAL
jgi:hypothetical protein